MPLDSEASGNIEITSSCKGDAADDEVPERVLRGFEKDLRTLACDSTVYRARKDKGIQVAKIIVVMVFAFVFVLCMQARTVPGRTSAQAIDATHACTGQEGQGQSSYENDGSDVVCGCVCIVQACMYHARKGNRHMSRSMLSHNEGTTSASG